MLSAAKPSKAEDRAMNKMPQNAVLANLPGAELEAAIEQFSGM